MSIQNCIFSPIDENRIAEIVWRVFEKAKKEHASHSRFALSKHVSERTDLSSKTIERAYDRYINQKINQGTPQAESVELLCKYLGFEGFSDFVNSDTASIPNHGKVQKNKKRGKDRGHKKWGVGISIAFGLIIMISGLQKWYANSKNNSEEVACMAWADSLYLEVSCNTKPYATYGTKVEPMDRIKLKNFKKVNVGMATTFFTEETNQPLLWYSKTKENEIEYFTAPGLHPTTGETLRKITPYIIQTYVPKHVNRKSSFVP